MRKIKQGKKPLIESGRLLFLVPVFSVIGLALVMALTFWLIYESELRQQKSTILQDVENSAQALRLQLRRNEFALNAIARDLGRREINQGEFKRYSENFFATSPEVLLLTWVNLQGSKLASASSFYDPNDYILLPPVTSTRRLSEENNLVAFRKTIDSRTPTYTQPFSGEDQIKELLIDFHTPVMTRGQPTGMVIATYSVPALLQTSIPVGIANRVNFGISYDNSLTPSKSSDRPFHSVELESIGNAINLYGFTRAPAQSNLSAAVNPLIFALMAIALISHIMLIRHAKRRKETEKALSKEITFRRAMEDSMPTGMRVIDSKGQISYVNSAFCKLVGLKEEELIGAKPPYPYWPPEEIKKLKKFVSKLLQGDLSDLGEQVIVMHNSGRRIITRMYTSPFRDSFGKQTGWMTSVTDITEPTRYRNELAHAQNRFTTVLQSLDTAVSVAPPSPSNDLLFTNETYKKWFGNSLFDGHRKLAEQSTEGKVETNIVFIDINEKWFDTKLQKIKWVDGRDVELLVASDVTEKFLNEKNQREQYERLQQTSKLVTMGEMASSLAHELNQPLAAISNYTSGAGARIKSHVKKGLPLIPDELLEILTKTAKQADRAGTVIKRIRDFIRRNDPSARPVNPSIIINDSIELAEINANSMGLNIIQIIQPSLPTINVDPILIEQVLLNLIKNGLESMKDSNHKNLVLKVLSDENDVIFSVRDQGPGVSDEIKDRLFESFFSTKSEGTGIGLNICRSVIESHGGKLWYENQMDNGCIFFFSIPVFIEEPISNTTVQKKEKLNLKNTPKDVEKKINEISF
ncbi:MAG: hypothetical protein CBC01_02580 [Betaproteobacteria bacterium TMED41]|nr:MAG: hypothetical protein CBC01_02580 [Betaproteobacteria bacterium TMED41]